MKLASAERLVYSEIQDETIFLLLRPIFSNHSTVLQELAHSIQTLEVKHPRRQANMLDSHEWQKSLKSRYIGKCSQRWLVQTGDVY